MKRMTHPETLAWARTSISSDVTGSTTDDQIRALIAEYEADANEEGYTLHPSIFDMMLEHRTEMRERGL